jgi:hypothetical protein
MQENNFSEEKRMLPEDSIEKGKSRFFNFASLNPSKKTKVRQNIIRLQPKQIAFVKNRNLTLQINFQ